MIGGALLGLAAPRLAAQAIPPATLDDRLEVTGESVAATAQANRLVIAVWLGAAGPFRFLVDSGADRTVVGRALATRLGLPAGPTVHVQATTGEAQVGTVLLPPLRIGQSVIEHLEAPALPEAWLGADGLLGIDALADQRLLLDFAARSITVQDSRHVRPPPPAADEIVVVARRRNGQLIITQADAGGVAVSAVIDSGAEVTVANEALRRRLFARHPPAAVPLELLGVTGAKVVVDSLVLPVLTVGRVRLEQVPVAFFEAPPFRLFGLADRPAVLLGSDVLRAFARVALDFRARRVRFRLRRA